MSTVGMVLMVAVCGAEPANGPVSADRVRQTIEHAIPFIEKQGVWWIEEKKCVTCHRVGNMAWSLGAARRRGITVSDQLDERYDWSIEDVLSENDEGRLVGKGNKEGLAQLMLAGPVVRDAPESNEAFAAFERIFLDDQEADGSWKPGGQLPSQKREMSETTAVSTMWIAMAVADAWPQNGHAAEFDRALAFINAGEPGKSTEWYAARLLLALKMKDPATASAMADALRGQQQADGGWGWIVGETSDALGTGLSLYALLQSGVAHDDPLIARAQRFLIDTQRADGAWDVRGTKAKKKDQVTETAVYWGATWALLGLTESLPK